MNITEAKKLAKEVATENRLFGWKIFFSDIDKVCGIHWPSYRTLEFSKPFFDLNSSIVCKDTILHEIAHALVGIKYGHAHGHDEVWESECKKIGAIPEAYIDLGKRPDIRPAWRPEDEFDALYVTNYMHFLYTCRVDDFETDVVELPKLLGEGK